MTLMKTKVKKLLLHFYLCVVLRQRHTARTIKQIWENKKKYNNCGVSSNYVNHPLSHQFDHIAIGNYQ